MAEDFPSELSSLLDATDAAAREAAWATFVTAYNRLLLHVARQVGRDYDTAMDGYTHILEQLRADDCRRLRAYAADDRSKFTTWLVVVARRLCLDFLRHRYGRARENGEGAVARRAERRRLEDLLSDSVDLASLPDAARRGPDAELIASEQSRALRSALSALDPRDRLILTLRFEDNRSAREIASLLHYPTPFHVYRRINTLLAALRTRLAPERKERGLPPFNRTSEQ